MQFESPYHKGRTVMTVSAENDEDLLRLSHALFHHEIEEQVFGDIALVEISQQKPKVSSLDVGKKYITGKKGEISGVASFFNSYRYVYFLLSGILIVGLSYLIYSLLKHYRAARKLGNT